RDIRVLTEVAVQLRHERLAEAHHLGLGTPLRVEVGPALGAADGHAGEGVLEDLLEAQELDDAEVHRRVEAEPALVRPESRIELDAEAPVELDSTRVVGPRHAEDNLALRLAQPPDDLRVGVLGMLVDDRAEALEDLAHGLVELSFTGIPAYDFLE